MAGAAGHGGDRQVVELSRGAGALLLPENEPVLAGQTVHRGRAALALGQTGPAGVSVRVGVEGTAAGLVRLELI